MNWLRIQVLRFRAMWIDAQIEQGEALLLDHRARLDACYDELRRIRSKMATITPAAQLLREALRHK